MASFSRILSHPAIVGLLQTGAGFTTQMQKDREEEEKLRRELAMQTFERQMQQLDLDRSRQQQLQDQATQRTQQLEDRTYAEGQQAKLAAENRYYAGLGSDNPALLGAAQDIAIDMGDPDRLAAATGRLENVEQSEKQRLFDKAIADGRSMVPEAQVKYYGELAKQYTGTAFEGKAGLFAEAAKAAKSEADKETKKWEADDASVRRAYAFIAENPNAKLTDRLAWGKGAGLTQKGWDVLTSESAQEKMGRLETETKEKRAHQLAMGVVTQSLRSRPGAESMSGLLGQMAQAEGGGTIEGMTAVAGELGVDASGLTDLYWKTYNDFMRGPGGASGGGPAKSAAQLLVDNGVASSLAEAQQMIDAEKGQRPGSPAPATGALAGGSTPTPGISAAGAESAPVGLPATTVAGQRVEETPTVSTAALLAERQRLSSKRGVLPEEIMATADTLSSVNTQLQKAASSDADTARKLGVIEAEMNRRVSAGENIDVVVRSMINSYPQIPAERITTIGNMIRESRVFTR